VPAECIRSRALRGDCRRGRTEKIGMPCTHTTGISKRCTSQQRGQVRKRAIYWEIISPQGRRMLKHERLLTLMCIQAQEDDNPVAIAAEGTRKAGSGCG